MTSPLSPSVPRTPPRLMQQNFAPAPDSILHSKEGDAASSANEIPVSSIRKELRQIRAQSTPTPPERRLEKTLQSEPLKTHHERRPPFNKRLKHAFDGTSKAGENISNDDSDQTPDSEKSRVPSPCGKKYYASSSWLKKHETGCVDCQDMRSQRKTQAQEICETALDSEHQTSPESEETCEIKAADEQLEVREGTFSQMDREASEELELGLSWMPSIHGADDSTHPHLDLQTQNHEDYGNEYVPRMDDKILSAKPSPTTDKYPSKANTTDCLDIIHATTLCLEDEANPEEMVLANSAGFQADTSNFHSKLRTTIGSRLTAKDNMGYIYIIFDPKRPQLHKIGRSKNPAQRKKQIEHECGLRLSLFMNIPVDYYARTERLIHIYLSDLCRPYKCDKCSRSHGEWFEISNESASAVVSRWVTFMIQENPYDPDTRQLNPFILDLVKRRDNLFVDANSKVETIREHWKRVLSPNFLDRFHFRFGVVLGSLWEFYWPVNTIFAWTVAFAVSHHPFTFMLMAASVIGTFISMSDEGYRLRNLSISSKKKLL